MLLDKKNTNLGPSVASSGRKLKADSDYIAACFATASCSALGQYWTSLKTCCSNETQAQKHGVQVEKYRSYPSSRTN